MFVQISAANGNCQSHVFQLPDRQHTIAQVVHLALLELPASEALVLLLQHNLRRLGSDICHAPDLCISGTKLLCATLAELFYHSSNFVILGKDSATAHESAKLLNWHLASMSHAISSQFPELPLGSQYFAAIMQPLDEAREKSQTIRGAAHFSGSC